MKPITNAQIDSLIGAVNVLAEHRGKSHDEIAFDKGIERLRTACDAVIYTRLLLTDAQCKIRQLEKKNAM